MTSFQSATLVIAIGAASALAGDALNPPASQWSARAAGAAVSGYRRTISPFLARTGLVQCRFSPTCSAYASEALRRRGFLPGAALTTWRLLRCNPFVKGGVDPVP